MKNINIAACVFFPLMTGILSAADNWKEKLQKESRIILA